MGPQEGINKQAVAEKEQERILFLRFSRTNVLFFFFLSEHSLTSGPV